MIDLDQAYRILSEFAEDVSIGWRGQFDDGFVFLSQDSKTALPFKDADELLMGILRLLRQANLSVKFPQWRDGRRQTVIAQLKSFAIQDRGVVKHLLTLIEAGQDTSNERFMAILLIDQYRQKNKVIN